MNASVIRQSQSEIWTYQARITTTISVHLEQNKSRRQNSSLAKRFKNIDELKQHEREDGHKPFPIRLSDENKWKINIPTGYIQDDQRNTIETRL